jgi:hypothetical protein
VNQDFAGSVLAAQERSAGGLGLLVVVGLLAASGVLFVFLSKSLRRMRENVASGEFRGVDSERAGEPVDPRQAIRRRSVFLGGKAPVIDGEVVEDAGAKGADGSRGDEGRGDGNRLDLPAQPGPPAGR